MDKAEKKRLKAQAKTDKKLAKTIQKQLGEKLKTDQTPPPPPPIEPISAPPAPTYSTPVPTPTPPAPKSSPAVRFAEAVKGIIYLIFAVTLLLAVVLGQKGVIIDLETIISNLLVVRIGQVILLIIALALFIYGLKHLRLVK